MRTTAGPVRLMLFALLVASAILGPWRILAAQQPDPAPTARVHVDSVEINLSTQPRFNFVVTNPTALRFESVQFNGQQLLHIWAYSQVEGVDSHIHRMSSYLKPEFDKAVRRSLSRALRDQTPERRLSYNRRLT